MGAHRGAHFILCAATARLLPGASRPAPAC
jgi:hypothetical protein